MPGTGKVYMIDRMTSDWAVAHPLDVDGFIEDVYQKYLMMAEDDPSLKGWVRSREELHRLWIMVLSCKNPAGDASLYPNRDGRQDPACMEVWHLAGDYWRRGLRYGDVLPERCPSFRITRLPDGGWISLSPKDMYLLTDAQPSAAGPSCVPSVASDHRSSATTQEPLEQPTVQPTTQPKRHARRKRASAVSGSSAGSETVSEAFVDNDEKMRKVIAIVGAVAITLLMIYFFGLLGPAVFGLLAGGILKG